MKDDKGKDLVVGNKYWDSWKENPYSTLFTFLGIFDDPKGGKDALFKPVGGMLGLLYIKREHPEFGKVVAFDPEPSLDLWIPEES